MPHYAMGPRWLTVVTIVALFSFARLVFADASTHHEIAKIARPVVVNDDEPTTPSGDDATTAANPTHLAAPTNDTCAGAQPLTLNRITKGDTSGAADDYQTLATAACYSGIGQTPTTAPGRDIVFSFTAPFAASYSFRIVQQSPTDDIANQNEVLYTSDTCPAFGTVDCLQGANRPTTRTFVSATGTSNNQSEEVMCLPMVPGQVVYVFFDDGKAGNNGGPMSLEPVRCVRETEPNDTPTNATPSDCGIVGTSDVAPVAHCYLGTRAGNVCTRSTPLDQSLPESNRRCSVSGNPCVVDTATGGDDCPAGEGVCQQLADLDCDPRCTGGPNDGKACITNAFCNPGGPQAATCSGTCQIESTCIITATGADTGTPCTPICVGGLFAGRYCSALSDCTGGGGVCTTSAMCPAGQTCGRQYNEGDVDFYRLGVVPTGNKIFAGLDAKSANDYDWRMRITTATSTLQFDDDDGVSRNGSGAPEIAGTPGTGAETFVKISRTEPRQAEPYWLYSIVRGPLAAAQLESEAGPVGNDIYFGWPTDLLSANAVTGGGYVRGLFNGTHGGFAFDSDCFKFLVHEGDLMSFYGDGEPARSPAANTQFPQPMIFDAEPAGISGFIFGANPRKNTLTPNATLNGLTPAVTSTFFQWRASYTGMVEVCYYDAAVPLGLGTPGNGQWAGSLDAGCSFICCPCGGADVSVEKSIIDGDGKTGSLLTYRIVVTNNSTDFDSIAAEVRLQDTLDPNLSFVSLSVDDGFDGRNTTCITTDGLQFLSGLPTPGTADVPIDCINASMAPGTTTTYTLMVQVNNCIGAGIVIDNTATISTLSFDGNPADDSSTVSFTTSEDGSCNDLLCDDSTCVLNQCTINDHCQAGECVAEPRNCDDNNVCTCDSCDPAVGCINDSSECGDFCDDFNQCTLNLCDPISFCYFPPVPPGTFCDDGRKCTGPDVCGIEGVCGGHLFCDDGNPCTYDYCDDNTLECSYIPAPEGTPCDDGNACTGTSTIPDSCNGGCVGGEPVNCNDGSCCTLDGCNPGTGCTHLPNTTPPTLSPQVGCTILWPPQHGYVDFTVADTGITAASACGIASVAFGTCHSSQPENGLGVGDGNSVRDCVNGPDGTLSVRAERDGACSPVGRVYSSAVTATDVCGNTASTPFDVAVWHDRGHEPAGPYRSANPGSNQNDTRAGTNGTYGFDCGNGSPCATGQGHDSSDADPEMEIAQNASISVDNLTLQTASGGNVKLTWTEPAHQPGINVTRFHVYRLDPVTLFWTQLAEVTKQTTSYLDPVLNDGFNHQYKITAMIK